MQVLVRLIAKFQIFTGFFIHFQIIKGHDRFHARVIVCQIIIQAGDFCAAAIPAQTIVQRIWHIQ